MRNSDTCLRQVTMADAKLLFDWRNDSLTRKNSFNTGELVYEDHLKWLKKTLEKNVPFFIMVKDNTPVGQVRLTEEDNIFYISYSIAEEYRGQGYGREILLAVENKIGLNNPDFEFCGEVKKDNIASCKVFEGLGYKKSILDECIRFTKTMEA